MQMEQEKEFLTSAEMEQRFSIKEATLKKQRYYGTGIPYYVVGRKPEAKRGGVVLYKVADVIAYLETRKRKTRY